jgi:RHS repeat-associated protein
LHEWSYDLEEEPKTFVDDEGNVVVEEEKIEDLVTWVYEKDSYVPCAKIVDGQKFSIISDYLGRPVQSFDENSDLVWSSEYDIYGNLENLKGHKNFIPFRQLGQYEDEELDGLLYNRFRYYDNENGNYISKDPIGLFGKNPTLYAYVKDSNNWIDLFGLDPITKTLAEWLKDHPDLLNEAREMYKSSPEWQGIDPDKTPVFYREKADVDIIRAKAGESGGHHPHGLALGGPEGQKLTITNETRTVKNPDHSRATGFQRKVINKIKYQ